MLSKLADAVFNFPVNSLVADEASATFDIAATLSPKVRKPLPRLSINSGPILASTSILSNAAVEENAAGAAAA
ncbi:hypothetical protein D3C87_1909360 [compost metagenome]